MLTSLCSRPECWQGGLFRNRICGWYWRSRPPIRINDISSWSYDIDTMDFMNTVNWNDFEIFFHWHSSCQRVVHVENDFSAKEACHLDNIGVVFWKVQSKARLGIFLPSYEAFLVWCYTGCHILVTSCTEMEVHLMDANTPLNVELRTFIESIFKCTIMIVKIILRLAFMVKLQKLAGRRHARPRWFFRLSDSKYGFEPNQLHCTSFRPHKIPTKQKNGVCGDFFFRFHQPLMSNFKKIM